LIDFKNVMKSCEIRYQLLINNISDVLVEIDLNGFFTYLSPQVHDTLGYTPQELVGSKLYEIIHPEDSPFVKESIERISIPKD